MTVSRVDAKLLLIVEEIDLTTWPVSLNKVVYQENIFSFLN